ncbi:hypothetical protein QEO77_gp51 [Arthrobacter phage Zaheer]|uniref:Uncharacterized protein n=1 Tax=Arthrobacter phage Zaheer TaxID=2836041 RepID=A0A8F3EDD8_9CAUD|nr:hypothetical protein QEO77_gp51 [Arthrobacter phage Zaheer]QWY84252.1 hypothetical protein SEA_ZAHEER_56 [Arthrobacter phage Zaheer]
MSAREELAGIIGGKLIMRSSMTETADAVIAAGYRKPRTITTREELDALPSGSVVVLADGEPNVLHDNGWVLPNGPGGYTSWAVAQGLPAEVVYEPGA